MSGNNMLMRGAVVLSLMASTVLYATNGDTIIGVGAKTRAMGGAGIALSQGAESTLVNPALITKVESTQISFGGTVFMPTIKTDMGFGEDESAADISMIPAVAIASRVSEELYAGIGMWGTAGMGVDFRDSVDPMKMQMETTLQLMQFAVPLAYKRGGVSIGVAPILQYGSLDIHYNNGVPVGSGQEQDFGFGASVGATYDFGNGFTVGAVYKSEIEMEYGKALSTAMAPMMPPGSPAVSNLLTQPAEIGIGLGYTDGTHSFAVDYKRIKWGDADGYKMFGWEDQDVFAVGYEYAQANWAVRVGYNHGSSPVTENANPTNNMLNLLGFPATAENHYTVGGSYKFTENLTLDLALVYSPESENTYSLAGMPGMPPGATITNKHSEVSTTFQFSYKF